ncbi:hypothetical protein hrd7_08800 [Leptolinea sp. HRD-7]|jgi:hypothetical protein|nr:hypothetical protein hrd7_08800 [Leptolinea sp. HRD-7]
MASLLGQKLQIKPNVPITAVNVPEDVKIRLPGDLPDNPISFNPTGSPSALLVFVKTKAEVEQVALPQLAGNPPYSPVWLLYPKGKSGVPTDVSRDVLWKMLEPHGWGPARVIALDEVWSAMRFTPVKDR